MAKFNTKWIWIGIALIAVFLMFSNGKIPGISKENGSAIMKVKLSIVEPDYEGYAIITGPKTKVDVTTVPFKITVINGGSIPLKNLRIAEGTIPSILAAAFAGKSIASLAPGASGTLVADVDVASLAPSTGSQLFNFQSYIKADYEISGQTFTKSGFSEVLPVTIMPSAGIAVTITYE